MMRTLSTRMLTGVIGVVGAVWSLHVAAVPMRGVCEVTFAGTSTLRDFTGTVTSQPFIIQLDPGEPNLDALKGVDVRVRVKEMDTNHATMNRKMHAMLKADAHPWITGTVTDNTTGDGVEDAASAKDRKSGKTTHLAITINGRTRTIPARIDAMKHTPGNLRITVSFEVSLKAYGIKAPTMLGVLRVGDTVSVTCDLILKLGR